MVAKIIGDNPAAAAQRRRPAPIATDIDCDECGKPMVIRNGRRGQFLGCSGYPKCKNTGEVPAKLVEGLGLNGNGQAHAEGNGKANGKAKKEEPAPKDTSEDDDIPTDLSVD